MQSNQKIQAQISTRFVKSHYTQIHTIFVMDYLSNPKWYILEVKRKLVQDDWWARCSHYLNTHCFLFSWFCFCCLLLELILKHLLHSISDIHSALVKSFTCFSTAGIVALDTWIHRDLGWWLQGNFSPFKSIWGINQAQNLSWTEPSGLLSEVTSDPDIWGNSSGNALSLLWLQRSETDQSCIISSKI